MSKRIAVLSFLFNWPSTGGGNIHTIELVDFLGRAGYEVRHYYARFDDWGIGKVSQGLKINSTALTFDDQSWHVNGIKSAFRGAVEAFSPDHVIITDSWNSKPILAEAVRGYPYYLRQQALECVCPLNNLRLLCEREGKVAQCPFNQFSTPQLCNRCLSSHGDTSGGLHRAERELCGLPGQEYQKALRDAFSQAQAVLTLNPVAQALLTPFAKKVLVVPWGMDPARFPQTRETESATRADGVVRLFMAGLIPEFIKGFHVLHEACSLLWQRRKDFQLIATGDPAGRVDAFTEFVGWKSQTELPADIAGADILVMPTIAQEGLGRSTVEAMAVGRPVIASRIGGLPYTVVDGESGLLFEPGDAGDLARKIEFLLDRPDLRKAMGARGRDRYEREFTWPSVIQQHYQPLFGSPDGTPSGQDTKAVTAFRSAAPDPQTTFPEAVTPAAEPASAKSSINSATFLRESDEIIVRIERNYHEWSLLRQTPASSGLWENVRFVEHPIKECDLLLILNHPSRDVHVRCPRQRIWQLIQEPPSGVFAHWHRGGTVCTRTWMQDDQGVERRYCLSHGALPWHVQRSYDQLMALAPPEKTELISWITSNKRLLSGHEERMAFLAAVRRRLGFRLFGRGFEPIADKWDGLAPYKYSIAIENCRNDHYWSEKIADCYLAWTMPIYCGCKKISEFFPPESMISIDIDRPDEAIAMIQQAIAQDKWKQNLDAIAVARERVLKQYQLFPFIVNHLRNEAQNAAAAEPVTITAQNWRWHGTL